MTLKGVVNAGWGVGWTGELKLKLNRTKRTNWIPTGGCDPLTNIGFQSPPPLDPPLTLVLPHNLPHNQIIIIEAASLDVYESLSLDMGAKLSTTRIMSVGNSRDCQHTVWLTWKQQGLSAYCVAYLETAGTVSILCGLLPTCRRSVVYSRCSGFLHQ